MQIIFLIPHNISLKFINKFYSLESIITFIFIINIFRKILEQPIFYLFTLFHSNLIIFCYNKSSNTKNMNCIIIKYVNSNFLKKKKIKNSFKKQKYRFHQNSIIIFKKYKISFFYFQRSLLKIYLFILFNLMIIFLCDVNHNINEHIMAFRIICTYILFISINLNLCSTAYIT